MGLEFSLYVDTVAEGVVPPKVTQGGQVAVNCPCPGAGCFNGGPESVSSHCEYSRVRTIFYNNSGVDDGR